MNSNNLDEAKIIIGRCLMSCPGLELWSQYLRFVKKGNEGKGPESLAQVHAPGNHGRGCLWLFLTASVIALVTASVTS